MLAQESKPHGSPDLSPGAAARAPRTSATEQEAAGLRKTNESDEHDLSERVPGLIKASSATVGEKTARVVEEAIWRILRPWQRAWSLQRVRYWYIGQTIDAVIHQDGSVEIRTKAGMTLSPTAYQTLEGSQPGTSGAGSQAFGSPTGLGFGIGISDPGRVLNRMITKKPQDNAEARRLLEDTRAVRERLTAEDAREKERSAIEHLGVELDTLWRAPRALAEKQERTFTLWDQCAEDATGREGQSRIEAFLRLRQETRGHCPYEPEQLARLNAARTSKHVFAPCTKDIDSGVAP